MKFKTRIQLGKRDLICLNTGSDELKFAYAKISTGRKEIANLKTLGIRGLSDEDISKLISEQIHEIKVKDAQLINVIPANLTITKNIEIPSQDLREIKEIIDLQVGRYTPYSREEIIIDYVNIGSYKKNYTKILLVIINRSIIRRLVDMAARVGLKAEKIFFAPESIALALTKSLKLENNQSPICFINVDLRFTDFIIALKGKLLFVRNIPIGIQHFSGEKERCQTRFIEEIKKSIDSYQTESIEKPIGEIVVTGPLESISEMETIIKNSFSIPCMVLKYHEQFPVSEGLVNEITAAKDVSYLDIIASSIQSDNIMINLIPEEIKLRKEFEERSKELIKTGILAMMSFILVFGILVSRIYYKTLYLKNLTSKYQPATEEVKGLEVTLSRMKTIRYFLANRGWPLELLSELYTVVPSDIYLYNIKLDKEDKFSIGGKSKSMGSVFALVSKMEDSKLFRNVKTKRTAKTKDGDIELVDFEIACILEKAKT